MVDNSVDLLGDVLSQRRAELAPEFSEQEYFEVFCAEQILTTYDLSYEELLAGIVDGEGDGGIDSVYTFVNGEAVGDDFDTSPFKKDVKIDLHIIQSKTSGSYNEDQLNKLISSTRNLLSFNNDINGLPQYNLAVKAAFTGFRTVSRALAGRFPELKITYHYACQKSDGFIHPNIKIKADELKGFALQLFSSAEVSVNFLDARKLLELARKKKTTTYDLRVIKSFNASNSLVVSSPLKDYANFLRHVDGAIRHDLFESNVRDFQGNTEVNNEIVNTLDSERAVDFWWMNNGVTIIATKASLNGDTATLENPQIVNGLQTSTQIANHFKDSPDDARSVMVKIISSEDEVTRDKIIKSTNSQNYVQPATLRATDKIHRDIEEALKPVGLFYDRRKNFYKNEGKSPNRIVSISMMAQAVMSLLLGKPDAARARPSTLIKDDKDYAQVFSAALPIALYTNAALLTVHVDRILRTHGDLKARDRTNVRFYVLLWIASSKSARWPLTAHDISKLDPKSVTDKDILEAIDQVATLYRSLGGTDQISKGSALRDKLIEALRAHLRRANPA